MMHTVEKKKVIFLGWVLFRILVDLVWKLPDQVEPKQTGLFWSSEVAACRGSPGLPSRAPGHRGQPADPRLGWEQNHARKGLPCPAVYKAYFYFVLWSSATV